MITIRPEVAMYAAFQRLNYRAWFALSEFVDNSLQSFLSNREALETQHAGAYQLSVEIDISGERIEIRDNAAGICEADYGRAFLPAAPPPDRTGLSEFGLGMKAAACWFANKWSVRTTALGEAVERTLSFNIPEIVASKREHLVPKAVPCDPDEHRTTLSLCALNPDSVPRTSTFGKIRRHLASIYRAFIRDGLLRLSLNDEILSFETRPLLVAAPHANPDDEPVSWRKEFILELDDGHRINGWAGILARGSVTNAGFALFRRRRLIEGSVGEAYRPEVIFGKPNKFPYQRIVGELHLDGFSVSHTKDGIQWADWEEDVLAWLKKKLDEEPLRLLDQATNYRARQTADRDRAAEATRDTTNLVQQTLPPVVAEQVSAEPDELELPSELEPVVRLRRQEVTLNLDHNDRRWVVAVELVNDPARDAWYEIARKEDEDGATRLDIRVNLAHPFIVRFTTPSGDELVLFTRIAAGLAIAEITAREAGVRQAGTLRRNLAQILRVGFSGPIMLEVDRD